LGDVTDRVQLTPVAIHEAVCFVNSVFGGEILEPDRADIATAVFSTPELAVVGLTEQAAIVSGIAVDVYRSEFRPMKATLSGRSGKTLMKLICDPAGRLLGAHILGEGAAEMAQLLGVIVKAGLTKAHLDATMAVHPTAAEELVTLGKPARQHRPTQADQALAG
jgi:glutathione reductase (NADPH)